MRMSIDTLIDRTKTARFSDAKYYEAINQYTEMLINDRVEAIKMQKPYSVQSTTRLRREISNLIPPTLNIPAVGNKIPYPADYFYFLLLQVTINGLKQVCWPTSSNKEGLIELDPFSQTEEDLSYYIEDATGWRIITMQGTTLTSGDLDYVRKPAIVSIGNEGNKISAGLTALTIGTTYYVYEECVSAGITHYDGESFIATSPILVSGIVIAAANIVNSDVNDTLHFEICRGAAAIMDGTIEQYQQKQDLKEDNREN